MDRPRADSAEAGVERKERGGVRVCVISSDPEPLVVALAAAGHEVDDCLATDVAAAVVGKNGSEAVLFVEDVAEMGGVTRQDALKALAARHRVILLAAKTSELVPYAAALGVRDFVFLPASPAQVLHRLANPATGEEAAEALRGVALPARDERPESGRLRELGLGKKRSGLLGSLLAARQARAVPAVREGERPPAETADSIPIQAAARRLTVAVWNPSGAFKTWTALNLAVAAARQGYDVALVNMDLVCPELDPWFGVEQSGFERRESELVKHVGIVTFGEDLPVNLVSRMLRERAWGVKYLPAGHKLDNVGTPDFALETMEGVVEAVARRPGNAPALLTVLTTASCFELPCAYAALKKADVIAVPTTDAAQERRVTGRQIEELRRVGVDAGIVEVLWTLTGRGVKEPAWPGTRRVVVERDDAGYLAAAAQGKPYVLVEGSSAWNEVLTAFELVTKQKGETDLGELLV